MTLIRIRMKNAMFLAGLGLLCLAGGCSTPEMKGTPFYTGSQGQPKGPAEQRLNAWPLVYYRAPTLSVAWPVFELTEDHTAVRPFFSVYGLDQTNRQYNVFWPWSQIDAGGGDSWVFPYFWGANHRVVFPLYWHYGEPFGDAGGSDSLFPLWLLKRERTNRFDLYTPWPLVRHWSRPSQGESGSLVLPLYWYDHDPDGSRFYSLPWWSRSYANGDYWRLIPSLYYQGSNATSSAFALPFWAQGHSSTRDWQAAIPLCYWDRPQGTVVSALWTYWRSDDTDHYLAPWLLSWANVQPDCRDLWLAGGLAHASWGPKHGSHYAFPFYYRSAEDHTFLTPLVGWNRGGGDYVYPATPLIGVRTDQQRGSWLFPIYSHSRDLDDSDRLDWLLLLGGCHRTAADRHAWFFPLFSFHDYGPLESQPTTNAYYARYGKKFWSVPASWYENGCTVDRHRTPLGSGSGSEAFGNEPPDAKGSAHSPPVREYRFKHGTFPLWTYKHIRTPALGQELVAGSVGLCLFNYKHTVGLTNQAQTVATNDFTRARILWRLWHYERNNGDVSVDVFPTITYDHKADGFKKTSFLWRFFRWEKTADGRKKLDVLFVPIQR